MRVFISLFLLLLVGACHGPNNEAVDHLVDRYPNGKQRLIYRYVDHDSLNRTELEYHENDTLFKIGVLVEGRRDGTWKSFYPTGQPWSIQHYVDGKKTGPYRTWHLNGQVHIEGAYEFGKEVGRWYFFAENGDTTAVKDM